MHRTERPRATNTLSMHAPAATTTTATPRRSASAAVVSLAALLLAGCVTRNATTTIGGAMPQEADSTAASGYTPAVFAASPDYAGGTGAEPAKRAPGAAIPSDGPSLSGLSREDWGQQTVLVPVDGPGYRPLYATQRAWNLRTARQRQEPPTPASALEGRRFGFWRQTGESFAAAGYGLADFVLIVPRMVATPPWTGNAGSWKASVDRGGAEGQRLTPASYWRAPIFESTRAEGVSAEPMRTNIPANAAPAPANASPAPATGSPESQTTPAESPR